MSFSADTDGAGPLSFLYRGIVGGFRGRYREFAFHEKTRDYEALEDRDLWLVKLDLGIEERTTLAHEIRQERGRSYPYTFFKLNCAHYLQELLAQVTNRMPAPSGTVSPLGVLDQALRGGLVEAWYWRPSASRRLLGRVDSVSLETRDRLQDWSWETVVADTAWTSQVRAIDRQVIQEYAAWKLLSQTEPVDQATMLGLKQLRTLNAREGGGSTDHLVKEQVGHAVPVPRITPYSRVSTSVVTSTTVPNRAVIQLRPAIRDEQDPWIFERPANTLEFGTISLSASLRNPSVRLEELVLFSQRAHIPRTWIDQRSSWLLEVAARRGGVYGWDALHVTARAGIGQTIEPLSSLYLTGLVTAAVTGHYGDGTTLTPGGELSVLNLLASRLRWGLRARYVRDLWDAVHEEKHVRVWLRWDLSSRVGLSGAYANDAVVESFTLAFSWYHHF